MTTKKFIGNLECPHCFRPYKNKGYYNVKINNLTAEFLDTKNFELNFNINAGEKFYFNDFKLSITD